MFVRYRDSNGNCVLLLASSIDSQRLYNCIESKHFYLCPMDEESCVGGVTNGSNCGVGYTGPLCALCAPNYYEQAGSCAQCFSTTAADGSSGAKAGAGVLYFLMFGFAGAFFLFIVYLYMREDSGEAVIKAIYWKLKALKKKDKVVVVETEKEEHQGIAALMLSQDKKVWFRPTKFIILLTYLQVFAVYVCQFSVQQGSMY